MLVSNLQGWANLKKEINEKTVRTVKIKWTYFVLNFVQMGNKWKSKKQTPYFVNWSIKARGHAFSSGGRACDLCLTEKQNRS